MSQFLAGRWAVLHLLPFSLLDAGYRMVSVGWDFGLLQKGLSDTIKSFRSAMK